MTAKKISLVRDFTNSPGGRYRAMGPHSGEEFRDSLLAPALKNYSVVDVDLNGARGLPASFIDEAFGGFGKEYREKRLVISLSDNPIALRLLMKSLSHATA